eukprot:sb/3466324/
MAKGGLGKKGELGEHLDFMASPSAYTIDTSTEPKLGLVPSTARQQIYKAPSLEKFMNWGGRKGSTPATDRNKLTTNLFRSRDWLSANQGPVFAYLVALHPSCSPRMALASSGSPSGWNWKAEQRSMFSFTNASTGGLVSVTNVILSRNRTIRSRNCVTFLSIESTPGLIGTTIGGRVVLVLGRRSAYTIDTSTEPKLGLVPSTARQQIYKAPSLEKFMNWGGRKGSTPATDRNKLTTNQNSLFRSRDWLSANQGPVFAYLVVKSPDHPVQEPIRTRHLGHVTGYQPIRDQYFGRFLILPGQCSDTAMSSEFSTVITDWYYYYSECLGLPTASPLGTIASRYRRH